MSPESPLPADWPERLDSSDRRARLVITGAAGYLGSRLVASASKSGIFDVRAVVRSGVPWLTGTVVTVTSLERESGRAIDGADAVIHLAGANEVVAQHNGADAVASTVSASKAVAEACARSGVARLIYVSTIHVYGSALSPGAVVDERTQPMPLNAYAQSRLESEQVIASCAGATQVLSFRLTNGVGPPVDPAVDRWSLVVNDLCRQAVCDGKVRLRSDGRQWRDFVALDDVDRILLAATDPSDMAAGIYNLGSGQPTRILDVARMIARLGEAGGLCEATVAAVPTLGAAPDPYRVSIDRLVAAGYRPSLALEEAAAATLTFCLAHRGRLCQDAPNLQE